MGMIIGFGPVAMVAYLAKVGFIQVQVKERREMRELSKLGEFKSGWHIPRYPLLFRILETFRRLAKFVLWLGLLVGCFAVGIICLCYSLARIFIVVECFIALFNSGPGFSRCLHGLYIIRILHKNSML